MHYAAPVAGMMQVWQYQHNNSSPEKVAVTATKQKNRGPTTALVGSAMVGCDGDLAE